MGVRIVRLHILMLSDKPFPVCHPTGNNAPATIAGSAAGLSAGLPAAPAIAVPPATASPAVLVRRVCHVRDMPS